LLKKFDQFDRSYRSFAKGTKPEGHSNRLLTLLPARGLLRSSSKYAAVAKHPRHPIDSGGIGHGMSERTKFPFTAAREICIRSLRCTECI
jgi:hypothetical protein